MSTSPDRARPDGRFPDHVVDAVVQHMNDDHADDTAVIARALGGVADVERAEVVDVDTLGLHLEVGTGGTTQRVTVPFAAPVSERHELREAVTQLFHAAVARLDTRPAGRA